MKSDDSLIQSLAEALEPIIFRAVMEAHKASGATIVTDSDIIGISEAAEFTGLKKSTIYVLTSTGHREKFPKEVPIPFGKQHNKLYFSKEELRAWLFNRNGENESHGLQVQG